LGVGVDRRVAALHAGVVEPVERRDLAGKDRLRRFPFDRRSVGRLIEGLENESPECLQLVFTQTRDRRVLETTPFISAESKVESWLLT